MILYHGSSKVIEEFDPQKTVDGGIHLGSLEQASMRCGPKGTLVKVQANIGKVQKSKDTGGNWRKKIESAKSKGYQAIRYINRYEGIDIKSIVQAQDKGIDIDQLTDKEFQKHFPEAKESYIVFDPERIRIVGYFGKKHQKENPQNSPQP